MVSLEEWFFTTFVVSYEQFFGRLGSFWAHFLPWSAVTFYYLTITYLPKILGPTHKGFREEIKWAAALWNLGLSILSALILVGIGIPYWEQVKIDGFWNVVCDPQRMLQSGTLPSIFWGYMFAISKYFELFDTVILILKNPGRKLLFLHWYHHITVLLFTWYGEYYFLSLGYQFILANAFVHLLMYFYYFLTELGVKPGLTVQIGMTSLQILQMVYGIGMSVVWYQMYQDGWGCSCDKPQVIIAAGSFMYFSYFCLFFKMFMDRYVLGKKKTPSSTTSTATKRKAKAQ